MQLHTSTGGTTKPKWFKTLKAKDEQIQLRESSNHDIEQIEFKSKSIKQIIGELFINEN